VRFSGNASPISGSEAVVRRPRRARTIGLVAIASAGLLSGCYYYPYGYSPWGYPPYPYAAGYPNGAANPYPPAPGAAPQYPQQPASGTTPQYPLQPAPGAASQYPLQPAAGAPQPLTEPVERTPLPPEPVP
jgi:hypothetical protein